MDRTMDATTSRPKRGNSTSQRLLRSTRPNGLRIGSPATTKSSQTSDGSRVDTNRRSNTMGASITPYAYESARPIHGWPTSADGPDSSRRRPGRRNGLWIQRGRHRQPSTNRFQKVTDDRDPAGGPRRRVNRAIVREVVELRTLLNKTASRSRREVRPFYQVAAKL